MTSAVLQMPNEFGAVIANITAAKIQLNIRKFPAHVDLPGKCNYLQYIVQHVSY